MKKIRNILLGLVVFACLLVLAKDFILRTVIAAVGSRALGAKVTVKQLRWDIHKGVVSIGGLSVHNPPGFPSETMMEATTVRVDYEWPQLWRRDPHIKMITMDVSEVVVVKSKDRRLNVNELKIADLESGLEAMSIMPLTVDLLKLNMGPVIYKDLSKGDPPVIKSYDVEIKDREFKNIKGPQKLAAVVLFDALRKTSIKGVKLYALAAFLGPTAVPVGITGVLIGKDHADGEYDVPLAAAYTAALDALGAIASSVDEDRETHVIKAVVSGHQVTVKMESLSESRVKITAAARKFKIPKPNFAGGILYQIETIMRDSAP